MVSGAARKEAAAMHLSRLLSSVSVGALTLILVACGQVGSARRAATAPPAPEAQQLSTTVAGITLPHGWTLVTYTAAIPYSTQPEFTKLTELKVTARCQPGERMVGAGYGATEVFEYNASIGASYPLDDHTWVAIGGTQAGIQIGVYCLHGDHLPTVVIASNPAGVAACPAGAVLLAEGFGQAAAGATTRPTYALCATSGVEAGARATAPATFDSNHNGYMAAYASVSCPAGQIAFGGGATGVFDFASAASADFTGWGITGGGEGSGAVYADCVRLI